MLNALTEVAEFLSSKTGNPPYQQAVEIQREKLSRRGPITFCTAT